MQSVENAVCWLCYKSCGSTFEAVGAVTIKMLGILGLGLDSGTSESSITCKHCTEDIKKYSGFKTARLHIEDCVISYKNNKKDTKLNLIEIFLSRTENKGDSNFPEDHTICRLCIKVVEYGNYMFLNDETKDVVLTKTILGTYFPEIDLDITRNPAVCTSCRASLNSYSNFMNTCLQMEEKSVCKFEATDSKSIPESNEPLLFPSQSICYKSDYPETNIIKNETDQLYNEIQIKQENLMDNEPQKMPIQHKLDEKEGIKEGEVEKLNCEQQLTTGNTSHYENSSAATNTYKNTENQEPTVKKDVIYSGSASFQNRSWPYKRGVISPHMLIRIDASERRIYQCEICKFETKYKQSLEIHLLHHKDASEVVQYQCEECEYKTKIKYYLSRHLLIHKNASEVMYQCDACAYKTRHKDALRRHVFTHKNKSDVQMYQCEFCTYKGKQSGNLKRHMLTHKSASEVTMYQCDLCPYKTRHQNVVKRHVLLHKNVSEVATHQCDICAYKTRHKNALTRHMVLHKNNSEITMYSCEFCTYKTKQKGNLKGHMLTHRSASEVA